MKNIMEIAKRIINRVFGIKLIYRLTIIYLLCGVTPMLIAEVYMLFSMSDILIQQEKNAAVDEIIAMEKQLKDELNTVISISKYFYFDAELEEIAGKKYDNYQENVNDIKNYEPFGYYGNLNNNFVYRISIFIENESLKGNSHFIKVDEGIRENQWYQEVMEKKGAVVWCMQAGSLPQDQYFAMTRLLSNKKNEPVGVLVIYLRNRVIQELVNKRSDNIIILLDEEIPLYISGKDIDLEEWKGYINGQEEVVSRNIKSNGKEYVLTGTSIALPESSNHIQIMSILSYEDMLKEVNVKRQGGILICLISMTAAGILILLFSKSYSSRVESFRIQMQKAADGNFDLEKKIGGNDEISELYEYLYTMIYSIQKLLTDIYSEQLQKERFKTKQKDAEFKMLASQINPHFLYNTLETIRMKARLNKEYEIEELVKKLSSILRYNLQAGNESVTIGTEIELLQNYLMIQKYRFGERIQYSISVEEVLRDQHVLPLIIQPIVENSIVHGLETKEGTGMIRIDIGHKERFIRILVEDDGIGIEAENLKKLQNSLERGHCENSGHIGVSNVHQRLKLYYGETFGLKLDSEKGKGTKVEIYIPYGREE
ncbi:histidine kinase [Lachnospiraceae bacterium OttesenSCG-928-D06]|nr:histidine kinase [Lachnospiraceae bacterium OttesenSCG-928-D06]